jgi:hypothetical protein
VDAGTKQAVSGDSIAVADRASRLFMQREREGLSWGERVTRRKRGLRGETRRMTCWP